METKNQTIEINGAIINNDIINLVKEMQENNNEGLKTWQDTLSEMSDSIINMRIGEKVSESDFLFVLSRLKMLKNMMADFWNERVE